MKRSLTLGLALSTGLMMTSCDSNVWLDATLPSLTGVYASAACQDPDNPQEVDVSMVLVNQGATTTLNILPTTKVAKVKSKTVFELMNTQPKEFSSQDIDITAPQELKDLINGGELDDDGSLAYVEGEDGSLMGNIDTLTPETVNLEYRWASKVLDEIQEEEMISLQSGGSPAVSSVKLSAELKERRPLLILLLDQSSTILLGRDGNVNLASDFNHQRLTFLSTLVKNLNDDFQVAVLWFSGASSTFGTDRSTVNRPVDNLELVANEINLLNRSEKFEPRTPLRQALADAKSMIEGLGDDRYDPVVVVFTDGTEEGDSSMTSLTDEDLASFFVERHVPVHTLQLRAKVDPSADPDEEAERIAPLTFMSDLACQTGGDFFYLRDADQLTYNDSLEPILRNRLQGRWSLKLRAPSLSNVADQIDGAGLMFSSAFRVTLGGESQQYDAQQISKSASGKALTIDQRLWLNLADR